ncbi:MAG: ABC transporter permease [Candidatus Tectomicrobia bacterium]|nr:ABC transporter permease [Candidatus Tectomicrobia bacterium]
MSAAAEIQPSRGLRLHAAFQILSPLLAVVFALLMGGAIIGAIGINPLGAYAALWNGAFGTPAGFGLAITRTIPLLFVGLSVSLAFRCGLFNIGGEGQLYMGALASTALAIYLPEMPWVLHFPIVLAGSFLMGGGWGAVAGWVRGRFGLNEIITTIMLNYIAFWTVSYLVHGPMLDRASYYPWSAQVPGSTRFPILHEPTGIHIGIVLALAAALGVYIFLWHTRGGFEIRATGAGVSTARFVGINVPRSTVLAMFLAGGLSGLAGTAEIHGVQFRLSDFFSPGYGFTGIAVALVGRTQPFGVVLAALLFGLLDSGSDNLQQTMGVPSAVIQVVQGVAIAMLIAASSQGLLRRLLKRQELRYARLH